MAVVFVFGLFGKTNYLFVFFLFSKVGDFCPLLLNEKVKHIFRSMQLLDIKGPLALS